MSEELDYIYIRAWGKLMGSYDYYTDGQIVAARQANAPSNALYKNAVGEWRTYDQLTSQLTKDRVDAAVDQIRKGTKT